MFCGEFSEAKVLFFFLILRQKYDMKIDEIVTVLESFAPTALQESFDNCGLLVGNRHREATGVLL